MWPSPTLTMQTDGGMTLATMPTDPPKTNPRPPPPRRCGASASQHGISCLLPGATWESSGEDPSLGPAPTASGLSGASSESRDDRGRFGRRGGGSYTDRPSSSRRGSSPGRRRGPADCEARDGPRPSPSLSGAPPAASSRAPPTYHHNHRHNQHRQHETERNFEANPTELFAALHSRSWKKATATVKIDPDQASVWVYRLDNDSTGVMGWFDNSDGGGGSGGERKTKWRTLPLHAAVLYRAPPKLLRHLLHAHPPAASTRDDRSMLPLHLALKTGANRSTVKILLEAHPAAIDERDDEGLLPLDLAKMSTSEYRRAYVNAVAEALYQLRHECDFDTNPTGLYAYLLNREWEGGKTGAGRAGRKLASVLTAADAATWVSRREPRTKEGGSGQVRWRMLPLHAALLFRAPDAVLAAILSAHPAATGERDDGGMLPLHVALAKRCSETVLRALLRAHPHSLTVRDGRGRLPIDLARRSQSVHRDAYMEALEQDVAYYLQAANEEECDFDDDPTQLYLAIEDGRWDEAGELARTRGAEVRTWVTKRAEKGKDKSRDNEEAKVEWRMLPLHAALLFAAPMPTIRALVQSYPDGCKCKSEPEGMLPVHMALKAGLPVEIVELLLTYHPDCFADEDAKGRTVITLVENSRKAGLRAGYMSSLDRSPLYWNRLRRAQETAEDNGAGITGPKSATSTALQRLNAKPDLIDVEEADLAASIDMKARAQSNVRAARGMDDNGILLPPTSAPHLTGPSAAAANYIYQQQAKAAQQHPEYYTTNVSQGSHGGDGSNEANFPGKKGQGSISQYIARGIRAISPPKKRTTDSKFVGKELVGVPHGFDVNKIKTRAASPPPQARAGAVASIQDSQVSRSSSAKRLRETVGKVLRSASRQKSRPQSDNDKGIRSTPTTPTMSQPRPKATGADADAATGADGGWFLNAGQQIQNVMSDLTDPGKHKDAPKPIPRPRSALRPQRRGLGYSPSPDAGFAENRVVSFDGDEGRPYVHVGPGAMLAQQEENSEEAPVATHKLVLKSGLKSSKKKTKQRSSTPRRQRSLTPSRGTSRTSETGTGVLRSGLKDKMKPNKTNRKQKAMSAVNQIIPRLKSASSLKSNPSMDSGDTLSDVQRTMNLLNPMNAISADATLLSRIGQTGVWPPPNREGPVQEISRAQSMESIGSSITNSMMAVRENASNKLVHTVDGAVDAMGDAMFNNTLVSGITSMFGEKEDETVKEEEAVKEEEEQTVKEEGYLKRISSWRKGKAQKKADDETTTVNDGSFYLL